MTTEIIISLTALAFLLCAIGWLIRIGKQESETIFESDYFHLTEFVKRCEINEVNEARIILRLNELNRMQGADREKLQVLNAEFRRKFSISLSDVVCHEDTEQ